MNDDVISAIRSRIDNDKSAVTYQWLLQKFNLLPNETESCMRQFISLNDGVVIEYLKCHADNIESSVVVSLKPSCDYNVDMSQYEISKLISDSECSHSIACQEAQRVLRPVSLNNEPSNNVRAEVIKNVSTNISKIETKSFPSFSIKKTETKTKTNAPKAVQGKSIKDSLKKLDSIIKLNTARPKVIIDVLPDIKQECVKEAIIEPVVHTTITVDNTELTVKDESCKKRTNLFDNFEDDSPQKPKNKRRRLIIESDDDDDIVLVNDSMIEEKTHDKADLKRNIKKNSEKEIKNEIKEDSNKRGKGDSKKRTNEDAKKISEKEITNETKEDSNKRRKGDSMKNSENEIKKEIKEVSNNRSKEDSIKKTKEDSKKIVVEDFAKKAKENVEEIKREPLACVPRKRKIMKQVERSFKDEDGFLVTQKVLEAFSDDENAENIVKQSSVQQKVASKPTKVAKKPLDINSELKKNKQMSLMSFFQKKN